MLGEALLGSMLEISAWGYYGPDILPEG